MEQLPHSVKLQIFGFLEVKDLLQARGVSRVWKCYAGHPLVWKTISVHDTLLGKRLFEAVLRVAPFVNVMHLDLVHIKPLLSTLCAAKRLTFSLWDDDVSEACQIFKRQLELGTLRELHVHMHGDWQAFAPLMEEIHRARNLVKVSLQNYRPPGGGQLPNAPVRSSLNELSSDARILDRHLQHLLYSHGKTLEVVSLPNCNPAPIKLLSLVDQLRWLDCPPQADMLLLLNCPKLSSLTVRMVPSFLVKERHLERVRRAIRATAEFLSKATQLNEYTIYPAETLGPEERAVSELILAPAETGDSALQHVQLSMGAQNAEEPQRALSEALPKLPQLRRITLSCPANAALMTAISPKNSPNLREIYMVLVGCVHEFLHQMLVQSLVQQNTSLHIMATTTSPCDGHICTFCRSNNCHAEVRSEKQHIGIFSHEVCDLPTHNGKYMWVRL